MARRPPHDFSKLHHELLHELHLFTQYTFKIKGRSNENVEYRQERVLVLVPHVSVLQDIAMRART